MSVKCAARCGQKSQGSFGALRYCRKCIAEIAGFPPKEFKRPMLIQLMNGSEALSAVEWMPDSAISRAREAAK